MLYYSIYCYDCAKHGINSNCCGDLNDNVIAGKNIYSGEKKANIKDIEIDDPLCSYGAKSGTMHCGKVIDKTSRLVVGNKEAGGISGDSGGPAWVPGKGFVGVYSAKTEETYFYVPQLKN